MTQTINATLRALIAAIVIVIGIFICLGATSAADTGNLKAPDSVFRAEQVYPMDAYQEKWYHDGLTIVAQQHKRPGNYTIHEVLDMGLHAPDDMP